MRISSTAIAVQGDAREERGLARRPLWLVQEGAFAFADADADADADAFADAFAYADADAFAYADADAFADAFAYADADADAFAYADAFADAEQTHRSPIVKPGLYAVSLSQSGRTVIRVGWFRAEQPADDEYECVWVTPYRGEYQTRLAEVWRHGPQHGGAAAWTWSPPVPSVAHRIHFQPLARLDPNIWAKICPKPEGWD